MICLMEASSWEMPSSRLYISPTRVWTKWKCIFKIIVFCGFKAVFMLKAIDLSPSVRNERQPSTSLIKKIKLNWPACPHCRCCSSWGAWRRRCSAGGGWWRCWQAGRGGGWCGGGYGRCWWAGWWLSWKPVIQTRRGRFLEGWGAKDFSTPSQIGKYVGCLLFIAIF